MFFFFMLILSSSANCKFEEGVGGGEAEFIFYLFIFQSVLNVKSQAFVHAHRPRGFLSS